MRNKLRKIPVKCNCLFNISQSGFTFPHLAIALNHTRCLKYDHPYYVIHLVQVNKNVKKFLRKFISWLEMLGGFKNGCLLTSAVNNGHFCNIREAEI